MDRGDVILTPSWSWHDHGKDGSGPMIWLDGLDIPSFKHFPVHFVEHYKDPRYPADVVEKKESPIVFPWVEMKQMLDSAEGSWAALPYLAKDGNEGRPSPKPDSSNFQIGTDVHRSEQNFGRIRRKD